MMDSLHLGIHIPTILVLSPDYTLLLWWWGGVKQNEAKANKVNVSWFTLLQLFTTWWMWRANPSIPNRWQECSENDWHRISGRMSEKYIWCSWVRSVFGILRSVCRTVLLQLAGTQCLAEGHVSRGWHRIRSLQGCVVWLVSRLQSVYMIYTALLLFLLLLWSRFPHQAVTSINSLWHD